MSIRAFLLITLLGVVSQAHSACSRPLRKQMQSWPPYSYVDASGKVTGLDNDLLVLIAHEAGCTVHFVPSAPGNRAMVMFKSGEIDVLTGFSKTPEREAFARYTQAYRDEVIAVFTASPKVEPDDVRSFEDISKLGLHLVVPLAGFYGEAYAQAEDQLQRAGLLTKVEGDLKMVNMMVRGHGELVMGDEMVIPHVAKSLDVKGFRRVALEANRDKVYIGLSKASTTERDRQSMDAAIAKLLANGQIAALIKRYVDLDR
jgi:polar amino acid transport system substrate-binding protein